MFKLFLIFISFISFSFGDVMFPNNIEKLDNFSVEYYLDKSQNLDIKTIQNIKFTEKTANKFTFGYIAGDIWFKITLHNRSQNSKFICMQEINHPLLQLNIPRQ